jgi:hypothetical protein
MHRTHALRAKLVPLASRLTTAGLILFALTLSLVACASAFADEPGKVVDPPRIVPPRQGKSETIQLFNGKDLKGWVGHEKLWSVEDGVIVGKNTEEVPVSTYLLTERKDFTDFRLTATVKLVKSEMHSGIAMWGRNAPEHGDKYTFAGHLVMFPSGWGFYDLFGRKGLGVDPEPAKKVGKQHDWNDLEILAQGNRIRLVVNGTQVADYVDPDPKAMYEGPIGLQLHSNKEPQEIHFKNLVLTTFPEDKLTTVKP